MERFGRIGNVTSAGVGAGVGCDKGGCHVGWSLVFGRGFVSQLFTRLIFPGGRIN